MGVRDARDLDAAAAREVLDEPVVRDVAVERERLTGPERG
jgi:hypothetical protein